MISVVFLADRYYLHCSLKIWCCFQQPSKPVTFLILAMSFVFPTMGEETKHLTHWLETWDLIDLADEGEKQHVTFVSRAAGLRVNFRGNRVVHKCIWTVLRVSASDKPQTEVLSFEQSHLPKIWISLNLHAIKSLF